jgi:cytochrome c5
MKRVMVLLGALLVAACGKAEPAVTFADSRITLPEDPMTLPEGPGKDAVIANCLACHSPSTMLQQPRLSREKWEQQVEKMVTIYKAPINPQDVGAIVDYLVSAQNADPTLGR